MAGNPINVSTNDNTWRNMDIHVDPSINPSDFVSGSRTWVYSSAVEFKDGVEQQTQFFPVGVMQGYSWGENKQIEIIFELGSELPYLIPGRTTGQISLSRILIGGADLVNMLQKTSSMMGNSIQNLQSQIDSLTRVISENSGEDTRALQTQLEYLTTLLNQIQTSGSSTSLGVIRTLRDVVTPINLAFVAYNARGEAKISRMFRNCWINGRSESVGATATIVAENCSIMYQDIPDVEFSF